MHGFNTDGPGFLIHLKELGVNLKGKRIAVLGAGGTARSILSVLCLLDERPEKISLYNRTLSHAKALVSVIGQEIDTGIIEVVDNPEDLNIELADLLINTTSVGMKADAPLMIDPAALHKDMLVYDVIYAPAETKLLAAARLKGARTANGLGMLFFQGVLAFQHWAEVELDDKIKKIMRKALLEKVNQ
jgi:shikimate dehydrogenase